MTVPDKLRHQHTHVVVYVLNDIFFVGFFGIMIWLGDAYFHSLHAQWLSGYLHDIVFGSIYLCISLYLIILLIRHTLQWIIHYQRRCTHIQHHSLISLLASCLFVMVFIAMIYPTSSRATTWAYYHVIGPEEQCGIFKGRIKRELP